MDWNKLGKMSYLENVFNTDDRYACKYIVETYDECIDDKDFKTFVQDSVEIISIEQLKKEYSDILLASRIMENVCELFSILGYGEFWVGSNGIFSTLANKNAIKNRTKLDYIAICMEYERLATLLEFNIANYHDAESTIVCLKEYGLDIDNENIYGNNDADTCANVLDRLGQIFGLH